MSVPNRAALLNKTHRVLKKHYQPIAPPSDRSLLEHLLYACCLENARLEAADETFAKLQEIYYDWNEVRVTTISELVETMASLPDPAGAASRLKRLLQSVFETHYDFDLDFLKKENIGAAAKRIEKYEGVTPFALSYVTQAALGGHAIAVDQGVLDTLLALGVISEAEAENGRVPGMERAIPKSKGIEFASLLHQLAADFHASPFSPRVRAILLEIAPDAKARLPKRGARKAAAAKDEAEAAEAKQPAVKAPQRRKGAEKRPAGKAAAPPAKKKSAKSKKTPAKRKKKTGGARKSDGAKKSSPTKRLAQKKPR